MIEKAPAAEKEMTYGEAILYCQFLEYNGHRDWRLPTQDEYLMDDEIVSGCWHIDWHIDWRTFRGTFSCTLLVTPVRDV